MPQDLISFLVNQRRSNLVAVGLLALILVGVGDYFASASSLEFSVFFVLPVSFFAWFLTRGAGFLVSAASAAMILGVNLNSPVHELNHRIAYWNALVWLAFLIARLKALLSAKENLRALMI